MSGYVQQRLAEISASIGRPIVEVTAPKRGHIYFAMADDGDCVKIGFTSDLDNRLASLRTGNHADIRIKESFASYQTAERLVHRRFKEDRIRGEWFRMTAGISDLWNAIEDYQSEHAKSDDGSFKSYRANMPKVFFELEAVERMLSVLPLRRSAPAATSNALASAYGA